jgi:pantetheine-phosphate adenylyltransferase
MSAPHALFPGTFDPITLGHVDLIERASSMFERVTVLVAEHPTKHHVFSIKERLDLVRASVEHVEGVEVATTTGLLVDACREFAADAVVRGVRGGIDLEYEVQMANSNRAMRPSMDTIFLAPSPPYAHISSTLVRQIAAMRGDVSSFVTGPVLDALVKRYEVD